MLFISINWEIICKGPFSDRQWLWYFQQLFTFPFVFPLCLLFTKNRKELSERMIVILKLPTVHCNRAFCFGNNILSSYTPPKQNTSNIKYWNRFPNKWQWEEEPNWLAICFFCTIDSSVLMIFWAKSFTNFKVHQYDLLQVSAAKKTDKDNLSIRNFLIAWNLLWQCSENVTKCHILS